MTDEEDFFPLGDLPSCGVAWAVGLGYLAACAATGTLAAFALYHLLNPVRRRR